MPVYRAAIPAADSSPVRAAQPRSPVLWQQPAVSASAPWEQTRPPRLQPRHPASLRHRTPPGPQRLQQCWSGTPDPLQVLPPRRSPDQAQALPPAIRPDPGQRRRPRRSQPPASTGPAGPAPTGGPGAHARRRRAKVCVPPAARAAEGLRYRRPDPGFRPPAQPRVSNPRLPETPRRRPGTGRRLPPHAAGDSRRLRGRHHPPVPAAGALGRTLQQHHRLRQGYRRRQWYRQWDRQQQRQR